MKLKEFEVERYFSKYEFTATYSLSSSDCDGYSINYVLGLASECELRRWQNLTLGYTETMGSEMLRQSIKKHYENIEIDEILVATPGELSFIAMNVLLDKGDNVICLSPTYQSLYQIAKELGCSLTFWEPEINDNCWYYNPLQLEKLIQANTKLIVINFPHNPTGFSPNLAEYNDIINIAEKNGIAIYSDEMYRFLHHSKSDQLPAACDIYDNAISLWGTSKTFGLAGLRLGWLTSKNKKLLNKMLVFKDYLSLCNGATNELLATIALNNLDCFLQPNLEKIKYNLAVFETFHQRNSGFFEYYKPNSGTTAFIKLNIKETSMEFTERLVNNTGIMMLPSETFEYETRFARIGFGRKNMPETLGILEQYISR
ncbi:MAG: aminotransferase class I/II-fold pyridoxal phosphate-dependent enzyme [Bacteroidia bacterium]